MTTSHKIVLSLIATICISLILFYSIQGNAQHNRRLEPTALAAPVGSPSAVEPASSNSTALAPSHPAMQTPIVVGRTDNTQPTGLDDLVAKVRTELDATDPTTAAAAATSPQPPVALANGSAATEPSPAPQPDVTSPAPLSSSEEATSLAPVADTSTSSVPQLPALPAAPSANAVAEVPSFTLGEPAADLPSPGGASAAKDERTKMPYDVNLRDLADMPVIDEPLPPLVRVRSNDEATAKPQLDVETKAETKPAQTAETPAVVIVVDPHKPAVKAEEPTAKINEPKVQEPAKSDKPKEIELALDDVKPSTNTTAKAPPVEAVKTTSPPTNTNAAKTYTIKPGDSFSSIATALFGAEKHWIDIVDANPGVDPKRVRVGQVINLPEIEKGEKSEKSEKKPEPVKTTATATVTAAADDVKLHEVKAGENLSSISRKHFNTPDHWRHIYLTNRELIGGDPSKLQAGTKLKITTPAKN